MILDVVLETKTELDIGLELGTLIGDDAREHYDGPYVVTPKKDDEQNLETKEKIMDDDVTVTKIPYSEVSNPEGGKTINIAYVL